jgi:RNA-binding protein YhbY
MARRKFHRHRVFDFTIGKNTVEKSIAEPVDGALNSRAFHKIDAYAKHTHPG